ncbi:MAG: thiol:disulfide interchange protein, partial [Bacteroidetes bacterium]
MRYSVMTLLLAVLTSALQAQLFDPVKWKTETKRLSATEAELVFSATIEDGWHLYSQHLDEGGPIPTTFTFQELGNAKL